MERRAQERSRRTRSERWYNKRSGEREGGRYTVCLVCFFRLAQNARQAFTAVFSSGSTAPLPPLASFSLVPPCAPMQRSLPSVARRERKNERERARRSIPSRVALLNVINLRFRRSVSRARASPMAVVH